MDNTLQTLQLESLKPSESQEVEEAVKKIQGIPTPPLEYQWAAMTNDDDEIYQAVGTAEEKLIKDVPIQNLKRFVLRDEHGRDMFGIDFPTRSFMIFGLTILVDLPEGKYELVNIRRNEVSSGGGWKRWYILGIKSVDQLQERYLYINPEGTFTVTTEFK